MLKCVKEILWEAHYDSCYTQTVLRSMRHKVLRSMKTQMAEEYENTKEEVSHWDIAWHYATTAVIYIEMEQKYIEYLWPTYLPKYRSIEWTFKVRLSTFDSFGSHIYGLLLHPLVEPAHFSQVQAPVSGTSTLWRVWATIAGNSTFVVMLAPIDGTSEFMAICYHISVAVAIPYSWW